MTSEREAYVHIQLPGTLNTVPAALLKVQTLPDGTQIGRFRYGDRYLQRADAVVLDPYRLPLNKTVHEFTHLKGIPGALRDARCEPGPGYLRFGLVSGLTVLDCDDSHLNRERWSYPLLADNLRRWSDKPETDCAELFRRMVFNAARASWRVVCRPRTWITSLRPSCQRVSSSKALPPGE